MLRRHLHLLLVESNRKRCKKGLFHEMTKYHIELCCVAYVTEGVGIVGKSVRKNHVA